uniref:Uncharacterized protein n=1 Tax=Rhizophora mucronata TaxID=61149 RepID=A0A2P2NVP0_RHIMU
MGALLSYTSGGNQTNVKNDTNLVCYIYS